MISACLILYNCEKWIAKTIESIIPHVDEIICVVDEKSNDNTEDVLMSWKVDYEINIKIFKRKWNDNFADAKNYAISKASGDYILFIEGDEILFAKTPLKNYIEFSEKRGAGAYAFKIHNQDNKGRKTIFKNIRLFKNIPEIYYEFEKDAVVDRTVLKAGYKIAQIEDIYVEHKGHILPDKKMIPKLEKQIELLFKQLKNEPKNSMVNFHIGETYQILHNLTKKENYLSDAITFLSLAATDGLYTGSKAMCFYRLARLYYDTGSYGVCTQYIERSLELIPKQVSSRALMFLILKNNGYNKEAQIEADKIKKINGNSMLPNDRYYSEKELTDIFKN